MSATDPIKVYDARWEIQEFSDDQVRRLFEATLAYGRLLNVDTLTLARDARLGGGRVMELALEAALRMGFRVFVCADPISTPQSYFTTLHVSQSHPRTLPFILHPSSFILISATHWPTGSPRCSIPSRPRASWPAS